MHGACACVAVHGACACVAMHGACACVAMHGACACVAMTVGIMLHGAVIMMTKHEAVVHEAMIVATYCMQCTRVRMWCGARSNLWLTTMMVAMQTPSHISDEQCRARPLPVGEG